MKSIIDFTENFLAVVQTKKEKGFPRKTVMLLQGSPEICCDLKQLVQESWLG